MFQFFKKYIVNFLLTVPTMMIPHLDQGGQDIVPGLLFHHHFIGEHTAVPTDMLKGLGEFSFFIPEPEAGMFGNVELAVGIQCLTVPSGLVM
jgi:hypothetical protein